MGEDKSWAYFESLIDRRGIVQFTRDGHKDYDMGYAIEDQARALVLVARKGDLKLAREFAALIREAQVPGEGVDMLRLSSGRLSGKADNYGEASAEVVWGLAEYYGLVGGDSGAKEMIRELMVGVRHSASLRTLAYSILGEAKMEDKDEVKFLSGKLVNSYRVNSMEGWWWFEPRMTYANALLPWALFEAYKLLGEDELLNTASYSLKFLLERLSRDGVPVVVGNQNWWEKGGEMALYDQQPIDPSYMVMACGAAFEATGVKEYQDGADKYYSWFSGSNLVGKSLIGEKGQCFDGLAPSGVNSNAGAESMICYLLARVEIENIQRSNAKTTEVGY